LNEEGSLRALDLVLAASVAFLESILRIWVSGSRANEKFAPFLGYGFLDRFSGKRKRLREPPDVRLDASYNSLRKVQTGQHAKNPIVLAYYRRSKPC